MQLLGYLAGVFVFAEVCLTYFFIFGKCPCVCRGLSCSSLGTLQVPVCLCRGASGSSLDIRKVSAC